MVSSTSLILTLSCFIALLNFPLSRGSTSSVPALFIFGDSVVDAGNNNELQTIVRANFPPYGRDIKNNNNINNNTPTGRFSNGKLAIDFVVEVLGFSTYPPPYLSKRARGRNLVNGANFASAASGYFDSTSDLFHAIRLGKQLDNYREYQVRLEELIGVQNASEAYRLGIHLLSTGSSDLLQNYYINPLLQTTYTIHQFSTLLLKNYTRFVQDLYDLGARKIGVTTLPPIGCVPAAITLFGTGNNTCVDRLNYDAISFNRRLNSTSIHLRNRLPGLNLIVLDIYHPLYNLIQNPADHGFSEVRRGCCGTGLLETSILCNSLAIGTCANATEYVFWDAFHPSEAANEVIATALEGQAFEFVFPTLLRPH